MIINHGPMLGSKKSNCLLKHACFLSPKPVKETWARNFHVWDKFVNRRVFILVERQRIFDLGILI